jgi:hypothetical protein
MGGGRGGDNDIKDESRMEWCFMIITSFFCMTLSMKPFALSL